MKLKICGIRTAEMARACEGGDVDYIGLNFVSASKRKVLRVPENVYGKSFKLVGIFQNASPQYIAMTVQKYDLDIVQLHGDETPAFIEKLDLKIPVWKALTVDCANVQEYCKKCELILFDSKKPGSGSLIKNQAKLSEAILIVKKTGTKVGIAGGINAGNVEDFQQKFPEAFLLDTASGIEVAGYFSASETRKLIQNFNT